MPNKKKEVIEAEVIKDKTKNVGTMNDKVDEKPYFFPRILAYVIDFFIITLISSLILTVIPSNKNYKPNLEKYQKIQTQYMAREITAQEFLDKSVDVVYDIDNSNIISMVIQIVVVILYFAVFQFYNKGQTIGKKLLKIRVISTKDGKLGLVQMILRTLIVQGSLIDILILIALLVSGRNYYYWASLILQFISILIITITLFMIFFKRNGQGLHDVITGTKVVQNN